MDSLTPAQRSIRMSRVKSRNTKPEKQVRQVLSALGRRYRLQVAGLPGRPDIVMRKHRQIVFVHGCFWHRHGNCPLTRLPKSRIAFWSRKFDGNRRRDARNYRSLRRAGWRVLTVWECQLTDSKKLTRRIGRFIDEKH